MNKGTSLQKLFHCFQAINGKGFFVTNNVFPSQKVNPTYITDLGLKYHLKFFQVAIRMKKLKKESKYKYL